MKENAITVEFETFNQKLIARDPYGYVRGFQIGFQKENKIEVIPVKAVIVKNEIVISLEKVGLPDVLRYAWEDDPDANLYNGSGLPAPPF